MRIARPAECRYAHHRHDIPSIATHPGIILSLIRQPCRHCYRFGFRQNPSKGKSSSPSENGTYMATPTSGIANTITLQKIFFPRPKRCPQIEVNEQISTSSHTAMTQNQTPGYVREGEFNVKKFPKISKIRCINPPPAETRAYPSLGACPALAAAPSTQNPFFSTKPATTARC